MLIRTDMGSSDTSPLFRQMWSTPTFDEVFARLRRVAYGVEECGHYPGLRWLSAEDDCIHRARPQDLEDAAKKISTYDGKDKGDYAHELVGSYLSSQLLPLNDADGNEGLWYSAVGAIIFEPAPRPFPSIRLTPRAVTGIRDAFKIYFEGKGGVVFLVSPITIPIGYLKQCGLGIARHILYSADVLQNSEKGMTEADGPRVFARAINGVPPEFPPSTDVHELEKAGSEHELGRSGQKHCLPFLISIMRVGDVGSIKWASRLFRASEEVAAAKEKMLTDVAKQIYAIEPSLFGELQMYADVVFLSAVNQMDPGKEGGKD
jgi:hypothetical protein